MLLCRVFDLQLGGGISSDRDNSQSSGLITRNSNVKYESPLSLDLNTMPIFIFHFQEVILQMSKGLITRNIHVKIKPHLFWYESYGQG